MSLILGQAVSEFLATLTSPGTCRVYAGELGRFVHATGKADVADLRPDDVAAYRATWRGLAPATVAWKCAVLQAFFQYLEARGAVGWEAAPLLRAPRIPSAPVRRTLSVEEARRLLGAVDPHTSTGYRDSALIALLLSSGLRVSEVCALDVRDFIERDGCWLVWVRHGKGGASRLVKVHPEAATRLQGYLATLPDRESLTASLFRSVARSGGRIRPSTVRGVLDRLVRRAGIAGRVTPHDLRATAATLSLRGGADVREVQAVLGHANLSTTARYLAVRDALHNCAVDRNPVFAATPAISFDLAHYAQQ